MMVKAMTLSGISASSALAIYAPAVATSPRLSRPIAARSTVACLRTHTPMVSLDRSRLHQSSQRGRGSTTSKRNVVTAASSAIVPPPGGGPVPPVLPESEVPGLSQFLDTLKFDASGMLVAIVQV